MTFKARVRGGRVKVDAAIDFPDGTEVILYPVDVSGGTDDAGRAALRALLDESDADVKAGRLIDADDVLKRIRAARGPA